MNITEKGISKPPTDLSWIPEPPRAEFWRWFSDIWQNFARVRTYNPTLTPAQVNAGTESVQTFTVTGLTTMDIVVVNKPTNQSGLDLVHAWVSAANTLSIKYRNPTAGNITPTSEAYRVVAIRI